MDNRVMIVGGGNLGPWIIDRIQRDDELIGADRGALFLIEHGWTPDLSIGDFDSVNAAEFKQIQESSRHVESCDPIDKDYTDLEMAVERAISRQPAEIVLLGASGSRLDHTLANIQMLRRPLKSGIPCTLIDEHNEICLIEDRWTVERSEFPNVSLLPMTEEVTGICLTGFKYPLRDATLTMGNSLGMSNVLVDQRGSIALSSGKLLVIRSKD